jgi:hypothetical protein
VGGADVSGGDEAGGCLAFYAGLFPAVELGFAFYTLPKAQNLAKMLVAGPRLFDKSLSGTDPPGGPGEAARCSGTVS